MKKILAMSADQKNVLVYRESGLFGGWPANRGIWSWGNEIVVGFSAAIPAIITNARQVQFALRLHF